MVSVEDSHSRTYSHSIPNSYSRFPQTPQQHHYYYTLPPLSSAKLHCSLGRSMRTIRSNFFQIHDGSPDHPSLFSLPQISSNVFDNLSDSAFIDLRLGELPTKTTSHTSTGGVRDPTAQFVTEDFTYLDMISRSFGRDLSACSSDISSELQRLATIPDPAPISELQPQDKPEPCMGFLQRDTFSIEIIESISPEDLQPTVKLYLTE